MKVIIAGSRKKVNYTDVELAMSQLSDTPTEIISGGAAGADQCGVEWARKNNIPYRVVQPDWNRYGHYAGMQRNTIMASMADALVAVWDGTSRGTRDMIKQAMNRGLLVIVHRI